MGENETCPGGGRPLVDLLRWLNLKGCPECRCAWDPDIAMVTTPPHDRERPDA